MVLDAALFNRQHYKAQIKGSAEILGKEEHSSLHLAVVAIEKGAFGSHSTTVTNFIFTIHNVAL